MSTQIQKINGNSVTQIRLEKVLNLAKKKKVITHRDIIEDLEGVDSRYVAYRLCQELIQDQNLIQVENGNNNLNEYRVPTKKEITKIEEDQASSQALEQLDNMLDNLNLDDFYNFVFALEEVFMEQKMGNYSIQELEILFRLFKESLRFKTLKMESMIEAWGRKKPFLEAWLEDEKFKKDPLGIR
ncbi:MAG: hypothetical protein IH840_09075 [Candidatus Heimdallarchaeota archaeon]|nr:hypothetical protein [Candidatus Heimdallarchaeota archaeon]